jgi:hypothetical protein
VRGACILLFLDELKSKVTFCVLFTFEIFNLSHA